MSKAPVKQSALQASIDEISALLKRDKAFQQADPDAWEAKQFNPTAAPDPIYDPLAKFESQLKAVRQSADFSLEEYDRLHPAPDIERPSTLGAAAEDVAKAGARVDAFRWDTATPAAEDLSLQTVDPYMSTQPNWFQRTILRQKPTETGTKPKFGIADVEDLFKDWEDDELDRLTEKVNLVEDQVEFNVDLFKDVALNTREQLMTGKMNLSDVTDYIKTEMERPLHDTDPFHNEHARPELEEIKEGDLPVLDNLAKTGLPDPPAKGTTFWENDPDHGELGRNFERMPEKKGEGFEDPEADDIIAELERQLDPDGPVDKAAAEEEFMAELEDHDPRSTPTTTSSRSTRCCQRCRTPSASPTCACSRTTCRS